MNTENKTPKIVLVTGGSRGIGKSIALHAAARGLGVILTYNAHAEQGVAVADEINGNGERAVALKLDSANIEALTDFTEQVLQVLRKEWGRENLDYLVNNAGIAQRMPIKDTTEAIFDDLVNVNFKGVFFLTQKVIPMIADGGQIINISSGLARFAFPGVAVYGALKSAYFAQPSLIESGLPDVGYFASRLNSSANYLSDLLSKYTGKSTHEHIHLKLVDKAKSLLWSTENSISEIAYDLGFEHPSHFTKVFKSKTGLSPREFRNLN